MNLTKLLTDLAFIQKLGDNPNTDDGLTAAELKEIFDKAPAAIRDYINDTLIPELETKLGKPIEGLQDTISEIVIGSGFLPTKGGTMTGDIAMGGHKVTGLGTPTEDRDAVPKSYADQMLSKSGGTMAGAIDMGGSKVTGLGTPTADADAATKGYVDGRKTTAAVTIRAENWYDYYGEILNAVALSGVTDDNTVMVSPAKESREAYLEHGVYCAYQRGPGEDYPAGLAFLCESVPSVDLTVNVVILA